MTATSELSAHCATELHRDGVCVVATLFEASLLQTLRNEGSIPHDIGWDLSTSAIWRPRANQNIVLRLSAAALLPGSGFRDLFDNVNGHRNYYSVLGNVTLSY